MLTILAGEPLASMMIVLRVRVFHSVTNCQCCVVDCQVLAAAGPGDCLAQCSAPLSRSLYFRQRKKAGKFLSMTTPAHDKEFPAKLSRIAVKSNYVMF